MIFDRLAKLVERSRPQHKKLLNDARLFRVDPPPAGKSRSEALSDRVGTWKLDEIEIENYRLPFPTIAIETASGREDRGDDVTILSHDGDASERRFRFLHAFARAGEGTDVEFVVIHGRTHVFPNGVDVDLDEKWSIIDLLGTISVEIFDERGQFVDKGSYTREELEDSSWSPSAVPKERMDEVFALVDKAKGGDDDARHRLQTEFAEDIRVFREDGFRETIRWNGAIGCVGMQLAALTLLDINHPKNFIVEETPYQGLPRPRKGQILRSPWRPHYIVLDAKKIRRHLIPLEAGFPTGKRAPHERRGHFRRYPDDRERFPNAHGQLRWVRPSWIGPREAVVGKNKYIVHLEEDAPIPVTED